MGRAVVGTSSVGRALLPVPGVQPRGHVPKHDHREFPRLAAWKSSYPLPAQTLIRIGRDISLSGYRTLGAGAM